MLEAGFQVKYAPPDGGAPVVFETLTDIVIDADLNLLRPAGYDRSQDQLEGSLLVLESEVEDLEIGDPLVLEDEKTGVLHGHRIQGLQAGEGTTGIRVSPEVSSVLLRGYTQVHLKSKDRLDALGPAVQETEVGSELHLTPSPRICNPTRLFISTMETMSTTAA